MATAEGYAVPGQIGEASAGKTDAGSALGRSSEPTFSAALTVWKGESDTIVKFIG